MKNLIFTVISVLAFCVTAFGQQNAVCPILKIDAPDMIYNGDSLIFRAYLGNNEDIQAFPLKWKIVKDAKDTAPNGKYSFGAKQVIAYFENVAGKRNDEIAITLLAENFPAGCSNTIAANVKIRIPTHHPLEYQGIISFQDEKRILDDFASALLLNINKDKILFYLFYITKKDSINYLRNRAAKISEYLFETYKISKEQIKFFATESDVHRTQVFLVPSDALSQVSNEWKDILKKIESEKQKSNKIKLRKSAKRSQRKIK